MTLDPELSKVWTNIMGDISIEDFYINCHCSEMNFTDRKVIQELTEKFKKNQFLIGITLNRVEEYIEQQIQKYILIYPDNDIHVIKHKILQFLHESDRQSDPEYQKIDRLLFTELLKKNPEQFAGEILDWINTHSVPYNYNSLTNIWKEKYNLDIILISKPYSELCDLYWNSQRIASERITKHYQEKSLENIEIFKIWCQKGNIHRITKKTVKLFIQESGLQDIVYVEDFFYRQAKRQLNF